jgi:hypothetical protein
MIKTVIRAAFGRTSFQEGTGEYNRLATNAPWNVDLVGQWGATNTDGAIPANQITLDQGFGALGSATGCTSANVTSAPASCFAGVRIHATDPNYRPAVSNQWNLTIQRELARSLTAQAGYVGQHSDHLAAIYDMGQNMLIPDPAAGGPYSEPGPYLAGNPTLKFDGTGQQRLNTSSAVQNYDASASAGPRAGVARAGLPVQLHFRQMPHRQSRLLRALRQRGCVADHGRCRVPILRVQRARAGLWLLRRRHHQRIYGLSEL